MGMISTIRLGVRYMEAWPEDPLLAPVFPENRVKYVMKVGRVLLPPFIILLLAWSFVRGGGLHAGIDWMFALKQNWHVTVICALTMLAMPVYGYYWLGTRAALPLNPRLKLFYMETCKQLLRTPMEEPKMYDLALLLREGIKTLGRDFLRRL